jgi:hypothetical protein
LLTNPCGSEEGEDEADGGIVFDWVATEGDDGGSSVVLEGD